MIFRPGHVSKMWDTWMYFHKGTYYLYYLITERSPGEGVGLATSTDGVHWQDHGWILRMADDVLWLGTGSVWKSPNFQQDGKFLMNFSEWRGPKMGVGQQTIFFAESVDLIHWERLEAEYEFVPDPRYYCVDQGDASRWDCIYPLPRPGGGYYGYWTANPKAFYPGFGFGETLDGKHWQALPAPAITWGDVLPFSVMEAGATEKFGDRYYSMLGTYRPYDAYSCGMFTFTAAFPEGPFQPARKNFAVLASPAGLRATYFARFFPLADGVLVNHQSITRQDDRYFGTLKRAQVDEEGVLRLTYWEGNDGLKGGLLPFPMPLTNDGRFQGARYPVDQGVILTGEVAGNYERPPGADAFILAFALENEDGTQTLIRICSNGVASFGVYDPTARNFREESRVDRETATKNPGKFRLLLRKTLLELYVDDYLMQCFSIQENCTGRIAVLCGDGGACLSGEEAYWMTLVE